VQGSALAMHQPLRMWVWMCMRLYQKQSRAVPAGTGPARPGLDRGDTPRLCLFLSQRALLSKKLC
jgi:hypothetical protein